MPKKMRLGEEKGCYNLWNHLSCLQRNFDVKHLMFLFTTSKGTVINSITTWINFMYIKLGSICIWPSLLQVKQNMPPSMKEKFPNVKCIIDC